MFSLSNVAKSISSQPSSSPRVLVSSKTQIHHVSWITVTVPYRPASSAIIQTKNVNSSWHVCFDSSTQDLTFGSSTETVRTLYGSKDFSPGISNGARPCVWHRLITPCIGSVDRTTTCAGARARLWRCTLNCILMASLWHWNINLGGRLVVGPGYFKDWPRQA